jgi:hypothetical protein
VIFFIGELALADALTKGPASAPSPATH